MIKEGKFYTLRKGKKHHQNQYSGVQEREGRLLLQLQYFSIVEMFIIINLTLSHDLHCVNKSLNYSSDGPNSPFHYDRIWHLHWLTCTTANLSFQLSLALAALIDPFFQYLVCDSIFFLDFQFSLLFYKHRFSCTNETSK